MSEYKSKMMVAIGQTLKAYTEGNAERPFVIAYSGGKDSTVAADILLRSLMELNKYNPKALNRTCHIVTAQTHMDFVTDPLKQEELWKIRKFIRENELPVEVMEVSAPIEQSFIGLVVGKGYPLPKNRIGRWCTERLKITPSDKAMKSLNPELKVLGVRLSESVERRSSIEGRQTSEFYADDAFLPIVNFTLDDVWSYLLREGTRWGDAEKLSQLYKDATGECGLRKKQAGRNEKTDDPCGARTGCIICPVVTIDKSSQEFAKHHPELQPYVKLRNIMIDMYKDPRNKAGRMRDGKVLEYGQGTFTVKARMKLYAIIKDAEREHEDMCQMFGVKPQKLIYSDELDQLIHKQWEEDLRDKPWLEDAMEIGRFYESVIKGSNEIGYQLVWNHLHDIPV